MLPRLSSDALREALASLPPSGYEEASGQPGPLREKVCAVVTELKAQGMKPEHVVLAVKGIAYEAQMGPASWKLIDAMVKWCLDEYFREAAD